MPISPAVSGFRGVMHPVSPVRFAVSAVTFIAATSLAGGALAASFFATPAIAAALAIGATLATAVALAIFFIGKKPLEEPSRANTRTGIGAFQSSDNYDGNTALVPGAAAVVGGEAGGGATPTAPDLVPGAAAVVGGEAEGGATPTTSERRGSDFPEGDELSKDTRGATSQLPDKLNPISPLESNPFDIKSIQEEFNSLYQVWFVDLIEKETKMGSRVNERMAARSLAENNAELRKEEKGYRETLRVDLERDVTRFADKRDLLKPSNTTCAGDAGLDALLNALRKMPQGDWQTESVLKSIKSEGMDRIDVALEKRRNNYKVFWNKLR